MRPMGRNSDAKARKVSPPQASYMSNDQFANYLAELRNSRVSRPGGARPLPASAHSAPARPGTGRLSFDTTTSSHPDPPAIQRAPSQATSIGAASMGSHYSTASGRARDHYPSQPSPSPLKPSDVVPSATYMERGQRWMEKEEAHSLRDAMEEMALKDRDNGAKKHEDCEEERIYVAALNEAAELVWEHQHGVPKKPEGPYRYKPHLRKNSYAHARTASVGQYGEEITPNGLARDAECPSVSGSSTDSDGASRCSRPSLELRQSREHGRNGTSSSTRQKSYGGISSRVARHSDMVPRRSSMKRNISGEIAKPFSGDQIWEEPETVSGSSRTSAEAAGVPNALRTAQPSNSVRFDALDETAVPKKSLNRVEIHRNPPTQSRNALYTRNTASSSPEIEADVPRKDGKEIRGEDIRAATSMKLKDRSPNLPEPTAVSDTPGRPIVSFDANWRAPEESTDAESERIAPNRNQGKQEGGQSVAVPTIMVEEEDSPRQLPSSPTNVPSISVAGCEDDAAPSVPTINVPTIAIDDDADSAPGVPVIVTPDDQPSQGARPLPTPQGQGRPKIAQRPRGHWSADPNALRRATAICHECGYPIEGRFVALTGSQERFHPQCLSCYCCGTRLEAMEISPEPAATRAARIERIARRAAGEVLPEDPGMTMAEDGDDRLRFYCHLDWHENFAPQCKHCKTPILEDHIVALGEHWHYGHFFCAECGDPFEHGMTHIEKDGYAWCVKCQTKRTERRAPKCKKCRLAVIGEYIQALGGEWHETCFRCATCQGGFDDGQIFPKETHGGGTIVLCTECRARELKM